MGRQLKRPEKRQIQAVLQELRTAEELLERILQTGDKQRETVRRLGKRTELNGEKRTPQGNQLVWNLGLLLHSRVEMKRAEELYAEVHNVLEEKQKPVKELKSFFRWVFSGVSQKQGRLQAFGDLKKLSAQNVGKESRLLNAELQKIRVQYSSSVCWEEFMRNSASYFALLEQIMGGAKDEAEGGTALAKGAHLGAELSEELVKSIEAFPLDTSLLKVTLRSYQLFGVKYALHQKCALLGDEMGLGKTVQAIAVMANLKAMGKTHFLVVCPVSVMVNWRREIEAHSQLVTMEIHGSDKGEEYQKWLAEGGVAVSTYETLTRLELSRERKLDILVADEAHYAKNPEAKRTKALQQMAAQAEYKLFMTGTPLENKVEEMLTLISALQPAIAEEAEALKESGKAYKFREAIGPVYLRRVREDVLKELPRKLEKEEWCRMNGKEEEAYRQSLLAENYMQVRQVSWNVADIRDSTKANRLLEICENALEEGRKVLVFSFFLDVIEKVQTLLGERCFGPITGGISADKRQEIVDRFSEGAPGSVLVSQIIAGGVGLNIQAASVVILCEPQWKPSTENQAISRAYRMGQAQCVRVHRLLMDDTVDERILEMLREKEKEFQDYAEESATEQMSQELQEKSEMAAIVQAEKKRLGMEQESNH